jgi:hypothetical protein
MSKRKTYFEQVPVEVVKKIAKVDQLDASEVVTPPKKDKPKVEENSFGDASLGRIVRKNVAS